MSVYRLHSVSTIFTGKAVSCALLCSIIVLSGCATTEVKENTVVNKDDPYESINRKVFKFNDNVDDYVAEPISSAYKFVTPQFMQTGVYNFFNNLKGINVVINDVLQAKFNQSAKDTGRLVLNTTLGLGGFLDVAKNVGLEQNDEDFEQTLAVWGVPQGSYLVLPFIGPSTARGIPGSVFDTATNPSTYVGWPVQLVSMLNARANAEGALKFIDEAALDPYVFTRESFLQWRNNLATDGKSASSTEIVDLDEDDVVTPKNGTASSDKDKANESDSSLSTTKSKSSKSATSSGKNKKSAKVKMRKKHK